MLARCSIALGLLFVGTPDGGRDAEPESAVVVRVTSATPGHEVRVQGVLLIASGSMRVVRQSTPFEFRSKVGGLVFDLDPSPAGGLDWADPLRGGAGKSSGSALSAAGGADSGRAASSGFGAGRAKLGDL